ncbi:MAG TPA: heme-binding protein [Candidatus Limnocylindrales bacterium]|nr:heme-binding protein [Candidatus Limnocylindrales bacterium]
MQKLNLWKLFVIVTIALTALDFIAFAQQQTGQPQSGQPQASQPQAGQSQTGQTGSLLRDRKTLTLELAKKMLEAAEAKARENGWKLNIAIVDDGGNLLAFHRMDGAFLGSIQIAMGKAHTAVAFQRETKAFQEIAQPGGRAYGIQNIPGIVILEGGLPIKVGEEVIGACGASGARGDQDAEACRAALDVFAKEVSK